MIYGKNTVNEVLDSKRKVFEVIVTDAVAQNDAGLMETSGETKNFLQSVTKTKV